MKNGFSSLAFIAFLVIFLATFSILIFEFIKMPTPVAGQTTIQYYPNGTAYIVNIQDSTRVNIDNIPNFNSTSLTCSLSGDILAGFGIPNCVNTFLVFTEMSSNNTFLTIILAILALIFIWAVFTLWGGS